MCSSPVPGAAGLTLAIDLARRNVAFRLIDKLPARSRARAAKEYQPRSQEVFEDLGVIDRLVAVGAPIRRSANIGRTVAYEDSPVMGQREAAPDEPYLIPLMVPQFLTEAVLRERLAELGHRPHFGCELTAFEQDAEGVTAHVMSADGDQTLRVRYLVGTDGGKSFVRHALNIEFPGETLGRPGRGRGRSAGRARHRRVASVQRRLDGEADVVLSAAPERTCSRCKRPIPMEGDIDLFARGD